VWDVLGLLCLASWGRWWLRTPAAWLPAAQCAAVPSGVIGEGKRKPSVPNSIDSACPTVRAYCARRAVAACSAGPPAPHVPLRALVVASAFHSTSLTYPQSHLGCSGRCALRRHRHLHPAGCLGPPPGCPAWRPGGCGAAPGGARRRRRRCTWGWTRPRSRMALPGRAPRASSVSLHASRACCGWSCRQVGGAVLATQAAAQAVMLQRNPNMPPAV